MTDAPKKAKATSSIQIVPARAEHLPGLVDCHLAALGDVEISLLGRKFVAAHHRFLAERPDGICLAAVDRPGGRVVGFIVGGPPGIRGEFLKRSFLRFAGSILIRSLASAKVRRRCWQLLGELAGKAGAGPPNAINRVWGALLGLSRRRPKEQAGLGDDAGSWSFVLFMGTHPDFRRRGVGRALLDAFRRASAERGYRAAHLTTRRDNEASAALYKSSGWQLVLQTDEMLYFRTTIDPAARP